MNKKNQNRGFIATSVLYSVVIIIVLCVFIILKSLKTTRNIQRDTSSEIKGELLYYEIFYDGNGHTDGEMEKQKVPSGEDVTLSKCLYSKNGYHFVGWTKEPNYDCDFSRVGDLKCYPDEDAVRNLTAVSSKINLYAQWRGNKYTVAFDSNGGSIDGGYQSKEVVFDSLYGQLPVATRENYIFDGWYTDKTSGERIFENTRVEILDNHTLYARWRPAGLSSTIVKADSDCATYNDGIDTFLIGRCSKNYVWYSGKLWRVFLKNNETGNVKMITDQAITSIPYQVRGNLNFGGSHAEKWLNREFLATLHDASDYLVFDNAWDAESEAAANHARPTGKKRSYGTVGLINLYEYRKTSGRVAGSVDSSASGTDIEWSVMTPQGGWIKIVDNYSTTSDLLGGIYPYDVHNLRPVIWVKSDISAVSGTGKRTDPYRLEGDSGEIIPGTTPLNTRYSGEYVNFDNTLYRIVSVEDGLTKITAVDILPSLGKKKFHIEKVSVDFKDASIRNDLENYYLSLDSHFKDLIQKNTTWYLGRISEGGSYEMAVDSSKTVQANIGLPRIGEMFTSYIARSGENGFWTLTPLYSENNQNQHYVLDNRTAYSRDVYNYSYGVRPSLYLKSTVTIASTNTGDGTYEHPYSIE